MTLGQKLKALRKKNNKSLRQVQKQTGISNSYLSELENDRKENPSMDILKKLADLYEVDLSYFVASENTINSLSQDEKEFFEEILKDEKRKTLLRESRDMSEDDLKKVIKIMKAFKDGDLDD